MSSFHPGETVDSAHLDGLARSAEEVPGYKAVYYDIRDYFFPPKLPPLKVTAKPVHVKSVWGFSGGRGRHAALISAGVHAGAVAVLFLFGAQYVIQQQEIKETVNLIAPIDIAPYVSQPKPKPMGGGGGARSR